jgi:hypothetical protein
MLNGIRAITSRPEMVEAVVAEDGAPDAAPAWDP